MATPITHIVLTEKIFDRFFADKNKKDFFVGSLLPDIRYLKVIERAKTHFGDLRIEDLRGDDSFLAGLKFHSILDITREDFMSKSGVYDLCPQSRYIVQSVKLLEDELFYVRLSNWPEFIDYFNQVLPEEINFGIASKDIFRWHNILQEYFQRQPDAETAAVFMSSIGCSEDVAKEVNDNVAIMKENREIVAIIEKLYSRFEALLPSAENN